MPGTITKKPDGEASITIKVAVPAALIIACITAMGGWAGGLATERGAVVEKIDRLERDVQMIQNDIGRRLHRVEASLNRIEGRLEAGTYPPQSAEPKSRP